MNSIDTPVSPAAAPGFFSTSTLNALLLTHACAWAVAVPGATSPGATTASSPSALESILTGIRVEQQRELNRRIAAGGVVAQVRRPHHVIDHLHERRMQQQPGRPRQPSQTIRPIITIREVSAGDVVDPVEYQQSESVDRSKLLPLCLHHLCEPRRYHCHHCQQK